MDPGNYFDNAATTPLDPRVLKAMLPYLGENFGNAHSIHSAGLEARSAVEAARELVARLIGAEDPSQIYFTSGATEANNWALNRDEPIFISPFEHSSLREPALTRGGAETALTNPRGKRGFVSVMAVNNETGMRWDVKDEASAGDILHSDATQAVGKVPWSVDGLDFASLSAHKFYGPKGIGALYCRELPPAPLLLGEIRSTDSVRAPSTSRRSSGWGKRRGSL